MTMDTIRGLIASNETITYIFFSTDSKESLPHIVSTENLSVVSDDCISVRSWFSSAFLSKVCDNQGISLVIWDFVSDAGFLLLGEVERIHEINRPYSFAADGETNIRPFQVERQLVMRVSKITEFGQISAAMPG